MQQDKRSKFRPESSSTSTLCVYVQVKVSTDWLFLLNIEIMYDSYNVVYCRMPVSSVLLMSPV